MPMWPLIPVVILLGTMLSSCGSENGKGESDEETDEKKEKDEKKETEETEEFEEKIAECESTKGESCTCNALVCCTSSENKTETVHIKKREEDRNILMADIAQLNRTDIEREKEFTVCKFSPDKKCTLDVTYIEDQEWKAYDESSNQGEGKELLNANESYMICTYGRGYLFFKDAGQVMRSEMEEMADLKRIPEKWNQEFPDGAPEEIRKLGEEFSYLKIGFRGDLRFYENPNIYEVAELFQEQTQTPQITMSKNKWKRTAYGQSFSAPKGERKRNEEKEMKKKKWLVMVMLVLVCSLMFGTTVCAAGTGDVAGAAIEGTWKDASAQIKTVVNKVVFPAIDLILAVFFFAKLGTAYFDYRKHGQFEWAAPAILFACLIFTLTAPVYIWTILGM